MGDYGVATANVFALLEDDAEDSQTVQPTAEDTRKERKSVTKPADLKAGAGVAARLGAASPAPAAGRGDAGRGRGRGAPRGRGGYGSRRDDAADASYESSSAPNANRGGRGPRRYDNDRERRPGPGRFDRQDRSGRGSEVEKRHGAGRGNWGAETDEVNEGLETVQLEEGAPAADVDTNGVEASPVAAEKPEKTEEELAAQAEAEAEAKQMTLDEYEALLAEKRAGLNKETPAKLKQVDLKAFEGMQARQARKNMEDEEDALDLKNKKGPKQVREKPLKERETVETSFRIADDNATRGRGGRGFGRGRGDREGGFRGRGDRSFNDRGDRGERGDRPSYGDRPAGDKPSFGGDRPYRGRGGGYGGGYNAGGRGGGGRGPNINVDDQSAFPTLGGK